ncbi:hypothetical protein KC878_03855 [Candidatus Saccharibacteria bacterium]|nr:hypothetical protein [Candidatus Saccharibacteria bacterium]MCB9821743.1 hypothetical protein [Candidatus Nomurabacteria bacterium]
MTTVYINGAAIRLTSSMALGKGGEADVYKYKGQALKLYKAPNHPDFVHTPFERDAATRRLQLAQTKLPAFPTGLPSQIIGPDELVMDKNGKIVGFTMPLIDGTVPLKRYGERSWRDSQAFDHQAVLQIFTDLHSTLSAVHNHGMVIGDFNDLNVLIKDDQAFLIDADSMQYGQYPCTVFTTRFADPLILTEDQGQLTMARSFSTTTDWYAYAVMLMQSLVYVDPYGGVFRPADKKHQLAASLRPLHRITVFHPEVRYPKPALPLNVLPLALSEYFHEVFVNDLREEFPTDLLDSSLWTQRTLALSAIRTPQTVSGDVVVTVLFDASDHRILAVGYFKQGMVWLTHDGSCYQRESDRFRLDGPLDGSVRFQLAGNTTLMAKHGRLIIFNPDGTKEIKSVDSVGQLPVIASNSQHVFWVKDGLLMRRGRFGDSAVGQVLRDQTVIWAGETFGFGYYRAGELEQAFLFDTNGRGINDNFSLSPIPGNLIDMTATFSDSLVWFFAAFMHGGQEYRKISVIDHHGNVLVDETQDYAADGWHANIRGFAAAGSLLFAATDEGLVRIEIVAGKLKVTQRYPDTEPYLDHTSRLFTHAKGIFAVTHGQIIDLALKPKGTP